MKTWEEMTPIARHNWIAEYVMGWRGRHQELEQGCLWNKPDHSLPAWTGEYVIRTPCAFFHPTTDHATCRLVEDEIERRDLWVAYTRLLCELAWNSEHAAYDYPDEFHWRLLRATPEQRCHAAWLAAGEKSTKE